MMDIKELERLAPTADEMLSGLHADETMKRRILSAAREEKKRSVSMPHLVPALCCAALAVYSSASRRIRLPEKNCATQKAVGILPAAFCVVRMRQYSYSVTVLPSASTAKSV